jgi:hypothetical protein
MPRKWAPPSKPWLEEIQKNWMDLRRRISHLMSMATTALHDIRSGDVIELGAGAAAATALVLLVSETKVILDRCDDSMPLVLDVSELGPYRIFRPELAETVAA